MAFLPLFAGPALAGARRLRNFRFRGEMADMIDKELKTRYRFSKNSIEFIADLISEDIERDTKRNKALSPFTQVLMFLRYVASGSFQQVVGDTIGVDKSSVSRVVHRVAEALCRKSEQFIECLGGRGGGLPYLTLRGCSS